MLPSTLPQNGVDFSRRAELSELMDKPCSREVLRACLRDLARVNRWFLGYRPVLEWLEGVRWPARNRPLHIVDVGCGYGDGLRRIGRWARDRDVAVRLTGIDLNPDAIAIAEEATPAETPIEWVAGNVFETAVGADVVVSSLFTHHLRDEDVIQFVGWMEKNARVGWLVNDLERTPVPYHLFRWFAKVAGLHPFVQHDGPVSFRRAFIAEDWLRLCAAAGLQPEEFEVVRYQPARLCVRRREPA